MSIRDELEELSDPLHDRLASAEALLIKRDAELKSLRKREKEHTRVMEEQQERIESLSSARFTIPAAKATAARGHFVRVVIPDSHGSYINKPAAAAFIKDLAALEPKEVILLGDHIDAGGFLAQHHTLGYVAQSEYTFQDDVIAANTFLDQVQKAAPKATYYYLEGNHERRLETWCVTQALRNHTDADFLRSLFSTESVLHIEKRGINFYSQGKYYDGCSVPSTIRLGNCYFTHGSRTGVHAARAMLMDFKSCVVYGHTHRIDSHVTTSVKDGMIGAWSPGCLSELQPLWRHTSVTGWAHGYAVQIVRPNGEFLHINVPIIDGKSFLMQLTGRLTK